MCSNDKRQVKETSRGQITVLHGVLRNLEKAKQILRTVILDSVWRMKQRFGKSNTVMLSLKIK